MSTNDHRGENFDAFYTADYYAASIKNANRVSLDGHFNGWISRKDAVYAARRLKKAGEAMSDATLHLSDTDFNELSDLLRRFGLNQVGREDFWREMTAHGWTQDTIDRWCAEYNETGQDRRPQTRGSRHGV